MRFSILWETEGLYVIDKPSGWLTTPARLASDPRPCLGRELQREVQRQIFPVHRLDFEVSGLTVWAKNPESHRQAQQWFENQIVRKLYHAWSMAGSNEPPADFVQWNSNLVRGKKRSFVAPHGKPSQTLARVKSMQNGMWLWELVAVTGRPHQLRFEMKAHGHAILGDALYGGARLTQDNFIALRAMELDLSALPAEARLGLPEVCRASSLDAPSLTLL